MKKKFPLFLLVLLVGLSQVKAQKINLELNLGLKNQVDVTENPAGTYVLETLGKDPWVQTKPIATPYDQSVVYVISFEYRAPAGLDNLQIFYGAPFTGARSVDAGRLAPSQVFVSFKVFMKTEAPNWSGFYDRFRLDVGKAPGQKLQLRNLQIRAALPGEENPPAKGNLQVKELVYKTIDGVDLKMRLYAPAQAGSGKAMPAIILFFGGGWTGGNMSQFEEQAKHFAKRGMVAVIADYRVASRHKTTPFQAVQDAKTAIRFLRANSQAFGIDPNRIAAGGGSAGGHLAAAADLTQLEEPKENPAISSRPNALVLFNPVVDNGPGGYGHALFKNRYQEISPLHNVSSGAAPTLFLLGTKDNLVPVKTAQLYKLKMEMVGARCELVLYDGQPHGFFNIANKGGEFYRKTLQEADTFLTSLGYLEPLATSKE